MRVGRAKGLHLPFQGGFFPLPFHSVGPGSPSSPAHLLSPGALALSDRKDDGAGRTRRVSVLSLCPLCLWPLPSSAVRGGQPRGEGGGGRDASCPLPPAPFVHLRS